MKRELNSAQKKQARKRLSALELAKELSNVSLACRKSGISRSRFYDYKRRFQTHGFAGLVDLPPIHKSHPNTTPKEVAEKNIGTIFSKPNVGLS